MIRPTGRTLAVAGLLLPLAALPTVVGSADWWSLWLVAVTVLLVALLLELLLLAPRRAVTVTVTAPTVAYVGEQQSLQVEIAARRRIDVTVALDLVGHHAALPWIELTLTAGEQLVAEPALLPPRRGVLHVVAWHARWRGPFGLLRAEHSAPLQLRITVLPNVPAVRRRALQMLTQRDLQAGVRVERYLGGGSEFESLREFVSGMDRRSIDWKATARHRTLLSREFRAERDHAVLLCIDTGRLMREPLAGMPRLDHAIHAALQLGYVCLRTGDRVGLHAFAEAPQHFLAPRAGMHAMQAIQQQTAALDYGVHETNFTLGMTDLLQRLRRRSLVVLFTDFVDSVTAELMLRNVRWLARRHLLLFVAMRDPLLLELTNAGPAGLADVHRAVVAEELHRERQLVLERIRSAGAQVVDAGVDELAVDLVNRYLTVKRRELV